MIRTVDHIRQWFERDAGLRRVARQFINGRSNKRMATLDLINYLRDTGDQHVPGTQVKITYAAMRGALRTVQLDEV